MRKFKNKRGRGVVLLDELLVIWYHCIFQRRTIQIYINYLRCCKNPRFAILYRENLNVPYILAYKYIAPISRK